mgnify:CR=1 FL=1
MNNDIEDLTDLIIELLRSCFFTEDGIAVVDGTGNVLMTNEAHKKIMNAGPNWFNAAKTGDQMNLPLLIGVMIATAFAAIITVCTKRGKTSVK